MPFSSPGDLPDPGIEPGSSALQADSMTHSLKVTVSHFAMSNSVTPWTVASGSSVHLQARMLEWVAIPFSRGSSQPRDQTQVSRIAGEFFTI